jgi:hypothetical protein
MGENAAFNVVGQKHPGIVTAIPSERQIVVPTKKLASRDSWPQIGAWRFHHSANQVVETHMLLMTRSTVSWMCRLTISVL